jgi:hypothetical protein
VKEKTNEVLCLSLKEKLCFFNAAIEPEAYKTARELLKECSTTTKILPSKER